MTELDSRQLQALRDALPATITLPPVAAITARGETLRRRRRAATALAGAGVVAAGAVGLALASGPGRPATLGVTAPATTAPAPIALSPVRRPTAQACPPGSGAPTQSPDDLIDPRDHGRTATASIFNSHATQTAAGMEAVAARVHDRAFATAEADGASDDIIVWRTGGAAGASPAYAAAAAKVGIPVKFRTALLSKGQIEATEGAMVFAGKAFAAAGSIFNSAGSDGHGLVTVGIDPLTDAGRAVAIAHAPYGAKSIIVVCDQGAVF